MIVTGAASLSNPFPGLRPFREDEEHLFFGRENQVDAMVDRLAATSFLAVVGTSGSGKSSLVNCGLRPALRHGLMAKAGTAWRIAQFRPGHDPVNAMARALAHPGVLFSEYPAASLPLADIVETSLRMSRLGLVDIVEQAALAEGINLLVVVDQFEELFRYRQLRISGSESKSSVAEDATAFVNLLLEVKGRRTCPIHVVLTMRSDFMGDCTQFSGLAEAINAGLYLVPRMTRDERRAAIVGPATMAGAAIAPVLVTRLVNDVGDNPDQLSILQHALNRTWALWQDKDSGSGQLELRHYEAIGTMAHALDQHAEMAYAELRDERERQICEKIFKALTDRGTDARGVRRPTSLAILCSLARASAAEVIAVLDVFREPSRSFLMPPQPERLTDDSVIDISHESLMRVWERLKRWTDEEAQSAQRYRRLSDTAAERVAGKAGLLRDPELQLSLDWRNSEEPNAAWARRYAGDFDTLIRFLDESEKERAKETAEKKDREQRELDQAQALAAEKARSAHRLRIGIAFALTLAAVAVGAAMWALQQRTAAEQQSQLATSRQLAAQAQIAADLNVRAPRSVLLALESIRLTQKVGAFSPTAARQLLIGVLDATGGIPLQHEAPVATAAVSPDGHWVATASKNLVQLWDLRAPSAIPILLQGHSKDVRAIAFSHDGRTLATVGDDSGIRLWEMKSADGTGMARVLEGGAGKFVDVAFSPDRHWLSATSANGTAHLWDLTAADPGTAISILRHKGPVNTLAFSLDKHWLATGSSDGTVRLWDLRSPDPSAEPIEIQALEDVRKVAFSPNSEWMVVGMTESHRVLLMRVAAPQTPFQLKVNQWVTALAFSPDGRWLATPSQYDARLWDLSRPDPSSEPLVLPGHKYFIADLAFSPNGRWFATGSADHTVQLWDVANRFTAPTILRGHEGPVSKLAFSSDSQRLVTASEDRTVRLWNISSPAAEPLSMRTPDGSTRTHVWNLRAEDVSIAPRSFGEELGAERGSVVSADGRWLATVPDGGGVVDLWDLAAPSSAVHRRVPGRIWPSPAFSPDGRWLLTAVGSGLRLLDLRAQEPTRSVRRLNGHKGVVSSVAFSADGHRLVTGAIDGEALVWDLTATDPSSNPVRLQGGGGTSRVRTVAISSDGRHVVTGSWEPDFAARVWDLSSPETAATSIRLGFTNRVYDVAISPDGRWVAAGSWDFTTQLLDLTKRGSKPFVLKGHTARTLSVAFSPDSQWLATGNEDQTARLWNLAAADPSLDSTALPATYKVGNVSFSPDGRWLALNATEYRTNPFGPRGDWFASNSPETRIYHTRLEDLTLLACRTAGRNLTQQEWDSFFGSRARQKTCPQFP